MHLIQNQLLSALPEEEYQLLLPNLKFVCLALGDFYQKNYQIS